MGKGAGEWLHTASEEPGEEARRRAGAQPRALASALLGHIWTQKRPRPALLLPTRLAAWHAAARRCTQAALWLCWVHVGRAG